MKNKNKYTCKAKKLYYCSDCGHEIKPGRLYYRINTKFSSVKHICLKCFQEEKGVVEEDQILSYIFSHEF